MRLLSALFWLCAAAGAASVAARDASPLWAVLALVCVFNYSLDLLAWARTRNYC